MKKQLHNESDIVGMITKIAAQLTALDKKVDALINKCTSQPVEMRTPPKPSFPQPMNAQIQGSGRPNVHQPGRPMYRATCADCKKECDVPFKPSGERPVYCKECFSRRKSLNTFKVTTDNKPNAVPPVQAIVQTAINTPQSPVKQKKKPAVAKKSVAKKKPASKKKKK